MDFAWVRLMVWPKKICIYSSEEKNWPRWCDKTIIDFNMGLLVARDRKKLTAELIKVDFDMNLNIATRYLCIKRGSNVIREA